MNAVPFPDIIQVGAVPPPYGGVSVHLERLMARLRAEGLSSQLVDTSGIAKQRTDVFCLSWRKAFFHLLRREAAIVHFHNFAPRNLYLYSILATRHKTILSFHNERFAAELKSYGAVEQGLFKRLLDNFEYVIVDSEENRNRALGLGIDAAKLLTIPEFLPPVIEETANDSLPQEISELRARHRFLLATNAYKLAFHRGEDLYGIDLIIEMTHQVATHTEFDSATVILLPNHGNDEYLAQLQARINALGIGERCRLVTVPLAETSILWRAADIVIRATNTDGNSMSVLEAISVGTPVIASDCVARLEAVELFENRNVDSLAAVTRKMLGNLEHYRSVIRKVSLEDNGAKFVELYRRIIGTIGPQESD